MSPPLNRPHTPLRGAGRKIRRAYRLCPECLEQRLVLSSWQEIPLPFSSPQAVVLLSDGRLLVEQYDTNHWYIVSPDAAGSYAHPRVERAHDSLYIHDDMGIALLKDGEVMVSGAEYPGPGDPNYNSATSGQNHIEIYNPTLNTWRAVPRPSFFGTHVIIDNSIKVLPDGRVLASTGNSKVYGLYDPATNIWTQTQSLPSGTSNELTLTMLTDGQVLAVGTGAYGNRSWVYDEMTGTWIREGNTPDMLNTGEGGPMDQLPDGQILAVGTVPHWRLTETALYSPSSGTWQPGPPVLYQSRARPPASGTSLAGENFRIVPKLAPGLALEVPGSSTQDSTQTDIGAWNHADNQIWQFGDDGNGSLTLVPVNSMNSALDDKHGSATSGTPVDIAGQNSTAAQEWKVTPTGNGYFTLSPVSAPGDSLQVSQGATTPGSPVELDPSNGSAAQKWRLIEAPNESFGDQPLAALPNGHLLLATTLRNQTAFYQYVPSTNRWLRVGGVPPALAGHAATYTLDETVLPTGQVLVAGAGGKHVFLYTPNGQPRAAWKPRILGLSPVAPGSSEEWIVGWGLNGISEGGVYGDDDSASTNYPLVRLTDDRGHVTYAPTSNWSTTQVGNNFETFQFTPPAHLPAGNYTLRVIASGISSRPWRVELSRASGRVHLEVEANDDKKGGDPRGTKTKL